MTLENDDALLEDPEGRPGTTPGPAKQEKLSNNWLWALLSLIPLGLMTCSMGTPWLVEIRPQSGIVSLALLALPTIGLICLPYFAVYGLGLALALLSAVLPRRVRNILSILYLVTLAMVIVIGFLLVAVGGISQLDGTWGNFVFALGAGLAMAVEIAARVKGRR